MSVRRRSLEEGGPDGSLWKSLDVVMHGELDSACDGRHGEEGKDRKGM